MALRSNSPTAVELAGDHRERVADIAADAGVADDLYRVTPYRGTPGREVGPRFLRRLYAGWTEDRSRIPFRGDTPTFSWEAWFQDRTIRFILRAPSRESIAGPLRTDYGSSNLSPHDRPFLRLPEGQSIAGAYATPANDSAYPMPTGETNIATVEADLHGTVLDALAGDREEQAFLQAAFRPVDRDWYDRGAFGSTGDDIAESTRRGRLVGQRNPAIRQTDRDKWAASDIEAQATRPAFQMTVRMFAVAPDPEVAEHRVRSLCESLSAFEWVHSKETNQSFSTTPLSARALTTGLDAAIRRRVRSRGRLSRYIRGPANVLTDRQLAELVHLPPPDVDIREVEYDSTGDVGTAPAEAPAFDEFDETGYSDGTLDEPL